MKPLAYLMPLLQSTNICSRPLCIIGQVFPLHETGGSCTDELDAKKGRHEEVTSHRLVVSVFFFQPAINILFKQETSHQKIHGSVRFHRKTRVDFLPKPTSKIEPRKKAWKRKMDLWRSRHGCKMICRNGKERHFQNPKKKHGTKNSCLGHDPTFCRNKQVGTSPFPFFSPTFLVASFDIGHGRSNH